MTHEQLQQMFSEESDDDDFFFGFESILLILCILYADLTPGVLIDPKTRCISYVSATYTRIYTVVQKIFRLCVLQYNLINLASVASHQWAINWLPPVGHCWIFLDGTQAAHWWLATSGSLLLPPVGHLWHAIWVCSFSTLHGTNLSKIAQFAVIDTRTHINN